MCEKSEINLGTRSSPLAMAQAHLAASAIKREFPNCKVNICPIKTSGDKDRVRSLVQFSSTGVFVKELEEALLTGTIDFAVHSLKDVPDAMDERLVLGGFLPRACPFDVLVSKNIPFKDLPEGAKIGTGSPRRVLQLKKLRPDVQCFDLRGNLDSRIQKVVNGELDAILLGAAGLERLNLTHFISEHFSPESLTPAIGQGIVGLQCRKDDVVVNKMLQKITDKKTEIAAKMERNWMRFLGGGCRVPLGAYADVLDSEVIFHVYLANPLTGEFIRTKEVFESENFESEKFKVFRENFVQECEKKNIPLPKNVKEHALMEFWGKG